VLYRYRHLYQQISSRIDTSERWGPARWYERGLDAVQFLGRLQTSIFQHGYLRVYLLTINLVVISLVGITLLTRYDFAAQISSSDIYIHEAVIAGMITVAMIYVLFARSRLAAVVALGVVGYGTAILFVFFG